MHLFGSRLEKWVIMEDRRVIRRPAPTRERGGSNWMGYGPGHHGLNGGMSGPANHPHVPAIEVALHHKVFGEVAYTLMAVNVPLSEVLATFCDDAGLELSDYVLEYNGQRLGSRDTPISLDLDLTPERGIRVWLR